MRLGDPYQLLFCVLAWVLLEETDEALSQREAIGHSQVVGLAEALHNGATIRGMDVRDAGRLGVLKTQRNTSKKRRSENARKAAKARWSNRPR